MFYEHLNDEAADPLKKIYVRELLLDNEAKRNRICTSVFTHIEVLPAKLEPGAEARYWAQFGSLHFFDIEIDRNVISLSREIKDYYFQEATPNRPYRMMSSGDSISVGDGNNT